LATDIEQIEHDANKWFETNWNPEIPLGEWWRLLADSGCAFPA